MYGWSMPEKPMFDDFESFVKDWKLRSGFPNKWDTFVQDFYCKSGLPVVGWNEAVEMLQKHGITVDNATGVLDVPPYKSVSQTASSDFSTPCNTSSS